MLENVAKTPEKLAEKFIADMIEETGCSTQFLSEAKPIILKLFKDVSGPAQDECLASIRETAKQQAKIEHFRAASTLHPSFAGNHALSGVAV